MPSHVDVASKSVSNICEVCGTNCFVSDLQTHFGTSKCDRKGRIEMKTMVSRAIHFVDSSDMFLGRLRPRDRLKMLNWPTGGWKVVRKRHYRPNWGAPLYGRWRVCNIDWSLPRPTTTCKALRALQHAYALFQMSRSHLAGQIHLCRVFGGSVYSNKLERFQGEIVGKKKREIQISSSKT